MLDENEINVKFDKKRRDEGFLKFWKTLVQIWHFLTPLTNDVAHIRGAYDNLIVNYFTFFRSIFILMLLSGGGFLYLCIVHLRSYVLIGSNASQFCDSFYPCAYFYSNFSSQEKVAYSSTMFLFAFLGFCYTIYQWLIFDRKVQYDNLYTKDTIVFARVLLNGWDWHKVDNPVDAET